jgi:sigma-E factor negative regulatory protein RseA
MDRISALMDGELGRWASKAQIERLERDPALGESWETYHLIGDALRQDAGLGADFTRRLHERLEQEPMVVAPHMQLSHRIARHALPVAAGFGGVAVVTWLALSLQPFAPQRTPVAEALVAPAAVAAAVPASAQGAAADYLRAHQEFSPSVAMQGVASYVRTVSTADGEGSR